MNYRSCEAINNNFVLEDDGRLICPAAQVTVENSLQRAYIFTNLFFYDITNREIDKLRRKINNKREEVINSANIAPDDVEKIFANVSASFRASLGDNSLDPLIKSELAAISRRLSLQLTKSEQKELEEMKHAICTTEIEKFKNAVIFTKDNKGKPYQVNFSAKYIQNLPPRAKRVLKPTIKMLAYMDGLQFDQFEITPEYQINYTWADEHPNFDEEALKDAIKSVIAKRPDAVV